MPLLKKIFSSLKRLFSQKPKQRKARRKHKSGRPSAPRIKKRKMSRRFVSRAAAVKKKKHRPSITPKAARPSQGKDSAAQVAAPGELIGEITHFFSRIQVVVLKVKKGPLKAGDKIRVQGTSTDFSQTVRSMQIESVDVRAAKSGQIIGLKVDRPANVGDKVYKLPVD